MANEIMITVDGVTMPPLYKFTWGLQDVSSSEAGRTEDAIMHKERVAQKRKLQVSWRVKSWPETARIISAFNPEYISVTYPDMMSGSYQTRTFYRGDVSAPVLMWQVNRKLIETVNFDLIER